MFPSVVFLWFFGWSLFYIGSKTKSSKPKKKSAAVNEPTFIVLRLEEKHVK
jgi:predicted transcriptional regulator